MMKRLLSALLIIVLIFSLAACNVDDGGLLETETPTETPTEKATQKPTDDSGNPDQTPSHTHEFGEWTVILEPKCGTDGIEERSCSCGEKEQKVITATVSHDIVGSEKIGFCRKCFAVVNGSSLKFPTLSDGAKTTVTEEEWMQAFELETLESFTLEAAQTYLSANGHYPSDLEEYPEEINWDIVEWSCYATIADAIIKYNDGCIFADKNMCLIEADTEDDRLDVEEQSGSAGGEIEMDTFRDVDWFTGLQIYEMLDDTIYDYEDYGFSQAVYSEESRTYRIDINFGEGIDAAAEILFENGYVRAIQIYGLQNDEDGEIMYQNVIMIFSDINEDKKVSEIDARDIYNAYDEIIGTLANATSCKISNYRIDEPMDFELDTLKDIVDGFVLKKVDCYMFEEGNVSYMRFKGEMRYLDGVEFDYNGDGEEYVYIYFDENGNIEMIEFRADIPIDDYGLVNSEYHLSY